MKKLFVETSGFTNRILKLLTEEDYTKLQNQLMEDPNCGIVMPGCGGLRKLRLPDPNRQKGKRSGFRVIYLHIPEVNWIFMVKIYGKDEQDNLTAKEKQVLNKLGKEMKREAIRQNNRRRAWS